MGSRLSGRGIGTKRLWRTALVAGLATVAASLPTAVSAHAELLTTSPDEGANLETPPVEVVLVFDGELDPDGSEFRVTDASGAEVGSGGVDLEVADRNELRGEVDVTEPGTYLVAWRSMAADGHQEAGEFRFGYQTDPAAGLADAPNTAVPAPEANALLVAAGLALVMLAGAVALWLARGIRGSDS